MDNSQLSLKFRFGAILIVALCLILSSWQADDAYHAYAMARNLVEGNGFVYIAGERVNASTCPLWTLICAGAYAICGNMYAGTMLLSIIFSTAAFAFIAFFCADRRTLFFCATLFVCSPCLVFGVSGLENTLLFFLSGLLLHVLLKSQEERQRKELFFIALLMALLAWTRMDIVLLYAPACVCAYLKQRHQGISFLSSVGIALLGLSPFVLWVLFSTWYYGFPFPNTAYAKLSTLLPRCYYLEWGSTYMFWSFICYISIPISLCFSIYLCCRKISRELIPVSLCVGIILYLIYIINIGGDFMIGRHYSVVLYLCIVLIARQLALAPLSAPIPIKLTCAIFVGTCATLSIATLFFLFEALCIPQYLSEKVGLTYSPHKEFLHSRGYSLEITWWGLGNSSWLFHPERYEMGLLTDAFGNPANTLLAKYYRHVQPPISAAIKMDMAPGYVVYHVGSASHLIDGYGLGDALIARLQSSEKKPRIGHVSRNIPEGYVESLQSGENLIKDPKIHEFYDHLKIVISGDLFSTERLREIWKFNTGQYSHLIHS